MHVVQSRHMLSPGSTFLPGPGLGRGWGSQGRAASLGCLWGVTPVCKRVLGGIRPRPWVEQCPAGQEAGSRVGVWVNVYVERLGSFRGHQCGQCRVSKSSAVGRRVGSGVR